MNCLHPQIVWRCGKTHPKHTPSILVDKLVFSPNEALEYFRRLTTSEQHALKLMKYSEYSLPCGKCLACKMKARKEMSVRLAHEIHEADECCYLTLTYNDDNIPVTCWRKWNDEDKMLDRGLCELPEVTLLPSDVQKFMKRLRRWLTYDAKRPRRDGVVRDRRTKIRYFAVGEYGGKFGRPHYHILIFGWRPSDLINFGSSKSGVPMFRSLQIERLWQFGFSYVEDVNVFAAKYCARYVTKKYTTRDCPEYICPEFQLQSTRDGGMGAAFADKYARWFLPRGLVTTQDTNGRVTSYAIPRYYWNRTRTRNLPLWLDCHEHVVTFAKNHNALPTDYDDLVRKCSCFAEQLSYERSNEVF